MVRQLHFETASHVSYRLGRKRPSFGEFSVATAGVREMKLAIASLVIALAAFSVWAQAPTLRIQTDDPNLPSDLYYGNIKVKPLRLRPGTNQPITIDDADFFTQ